MPEVNENEHEDQQEAPPIVIKPTVGRVVHYYPGINERVMCNGKDPVIGLVAAVLSDRSVNLACFDAEGRPFNRECILLIQPGDEVPEHRNIGYAAWMGYQIDQVAKID